MSYFTKYVCFYKLDENHTLLLNTITSAMDIVDNDTYDKIQEMIKDSKNINCKPNELLSKKLKLRGYIFENVEEEKKQINKLITINQKMQDKKVPYRFVICPTMGCNLRCTYCFEGEGLHKKFDLLSDGQLATIFNYIKECSARYIEQQKSEPSIGSGRQPYITLFGGEPLLKCNFNIVKKILDFSRQVKMPVAIVTNATTIDDDYYDLLRKYKDNFVTIQVTMDGNKSVHDKRRIHADGSGTFESICDGINKVLKIGIKINLRINVDTENISQLGELEEVFKKQGWSKNPLFVPYASPVKCYNENKNSDDIITESSLLNTLIKKGFYGKENSFLNTLLSPVYGITTSFFNTPGNKTKPLKQTYCEGTSGTQYCFTPDGCISTCLTCVGNKDYRVGTFDENGVNIDNYRLQKWTRRNPFEMDKCKNCKYIFLCGGGCPVEALESNRDINCPECDDMENTLKEYVEHIKNKLLRSKEK